MNKYDAIGHIEGSYKRQKNGNWYRPSGDYFAVKSKCKQIFQGFSTIEDAEIFGRSLESQPVEIINSPWFLDVI